MAELVAESNVPITFLGFAPLASLVKVNLAPASFSPFSSVLTIWRRSYVLLVKLPQAVPSILWLTVTVLPICFEVSIRAASLLNLSPGFALSAKSVI